MGFWWTGAGESRERFLRLILVAVYLLVPLVWFPEVSFEPVKAALFLALFLPAFATWLIGVSRRWLSAAPPELTAPLGVLLGVSALSLVGIASWRLATADLFWLLTLGLFLLFLVDMMRRPGVIEILSQAVCSSAAAVAAFGIFQFYDLFNFEVADSTRPFIFSTIGNPNPAANFVATSLPLMGALMLLSEGFRSWAWAALIALCYAFLVLAQSRASWLALILGIAFALLVGWRARAFNLSREKIRGLLWLTVVVAVVTCIYTVPNPLNKRISPLERVQATFVPDTGEYLSWSGRQLVLHVVQRILRDHPLLGVGIGNFPAVSAEYFGQVLGDHGSRSGVGFWWEAHNEYVQILAELGPIGLLAFLGLVLPPVFSAVRSLSTLPPPVALSFLGILSGLVAFLVNSWFDFPLRKPPNVLLFLFLLGATYAMNQRVQAGGLRSASKGGGVRRWPVIVSTLASAVSRVQEPIAVVCLGILAIGTAFTGGHLGGAILMPRAEMSLVSGDTDAAAAAFQRARHLAPFKWDVPVALGALYAISGRPKEAIEALVEAEQFVKEATIARIRGMAYRQMGSPEAARAEYRRALFYNPSDLEARLGLALTYRDVGDHRAAAEEARLGLKVSPQNGRLRYVLGASLAKLGESDEALGELLVAMHLQESEREAPAVLEEVARTVGRPDVAARARRRLSAIAAVEEAAGARRRSLAEAEAWLANALRRDPDYAYPHFELGRLYFGPRPQDAVKAFRAYIQKAPMGEKAEEALRFATILEHPSLLARLLGRDPRFDVGI